MEHEETNTYMEATGKFRYIRKKKWLFISYMHLQQEYAVHRITGNATKIWKDIPIQK